MCVCAWGVSTRQLAEAISRVGTAPSAAGARRPFASIIGHVTCAGFWIPNTMGVIFITFRDAVFLLSGVKLLRPHMSVWIYGVLF